MSPEALPSHGGGWGGGSGFLLVCHFHRHWVQNSESIERVTMHVTQHSQSGLRWIPAFKMEAVLSVSPFTVISAFLGLFTPHSVYSENFVISSSVINPWVCVCSWVPFLGSTNKNSDSHFISNNMDKTQTIIVSEKSQTQHATLWIISFVRFKGGLEQDIRDLLRVAEMFYWGDNCKNVLICLNTSNTVLKIWRDLLYLNYTSIKLSLRKRTHVKKIWRKIDI